MSPDKREKRFLEALRASGLVPPGEVDRALAFQSYARQRGRSLPLDRILLRFELLSEHEIGGLYESVRYFLWRKEDKFYAKIAVQSAILTREDTKRCLKEQKRDFYEKQLLRRLNAIASEKGLLDAKQDEALIAALRRVKPGATLRPLAASPAGRAPGPPVAPTEAPLTGSRGPARKGEEERWRREVRARELAELSEIARGAASPTPAGDARRGPGGTDRLDDSSRGSGAKGSPAAGSESSALPLTSDEDLDPLWDEADLDDIELDSDARDAARGTRGAADRSDEDETDLFG